MRLEDMKNDIPETPDFIHNMIQNEVAKQLADNKVANLRRRKRWTAPITIWNQVLEDSEEILFLQQKPDLLH